jgi:hypothetical protein
MALRRVWIPSRNYSSRGGAGVRLVVIHTAEGARTYQSLGSFFQGNVAASSQVGIDDTPGTIGEYVRRSDKSWTQAEFNPVSTSVELCAFARWDRAEWNRHPAMLRNVADWIAEECRHFGIPIVKLSAAQAQGSGRGVCGHVELGARGGGHWDPGPGFPWSDVIAMAKGGGGTVVPPTPEVFDMVAAEVADNGMLHVFSVSADGSALNYTWQPKPGSWNGGQPGKRVAGLSRLASAPQGRKIRGVAARKASNGSLHVFAWLDDGSLAYTYQSRGTTSWAGGGPGKGVAALSAFAPKP